MSTIVINAKSEKIKAISEFLKAFEVSFEIKTEGESTYNPDFVDAVLESKRQYEEGKYTSIKTEDLWK